MAMLTIDALDAYGANTGAGLARCFGDEPFYLGLVEMLICDEKFDLLAAAIHERNTAACLYISYALADIANGLALTPLAQQIEQMLLCLKLHGDSAVVDRQFRFVQNGLETLRVIQRA